MSHISHFVCQTSKIIYQGQKTKTSWLVERTLKQLDLGLQSISCINSKSVTYCWAEVNPEPFGIWNAVKIEKLHFCAKN